MYGYRDQKEYSVKDKGWVVEGEVTNWMRRSLGIVEPDPPLCSKRDNKGTGDNKRPRGAVANQRSRTGIRCAVVVDTIQRTWGRCKFGCHASALLYYRHAGIFRPFPCRCHASLRRVHQADQQPQIRAIQQQQQTCTCAVSEAHKKEEEQGSCLMFSGTISPNSNGSRFGNSSFLDLSLISVSLYHWLLTDHQVAVQNRQSSA